MKNNKILKFILPTLMFATILIMWQVFSYYRIINPFLFSNPTDIFLNSFKINNLTIHIYYSIFRLFFSVLYGYLLGFLIGILLFQNKKLKFLRNLFDFLMSIPGIAWAPIIIIIIGFGNNTVITAGAIAAFFPAIFNTYAGLRNVDKNYLKLSKLLEFNTSKLIFSIYLPAISNYLLYGLRESISRAWRTIIAVEMIAASNYGLGYLTFESRELLNINVMYAGIIFSGIIYLLIDLLLINFIEKNTVVKWGMKLRYE